MLAVPPDLRRCLRRHGFSRRRRVRPLCVPAVGDPPARCASMSHVIPLRVFQMLNSHRWDCNVLRCSLKLTVLNYVRLMFCSGPAVAHWHRGQALQAPQRPPTGRGLSLFVASVLIAHRLAISHVIPLRVFQMLNLHRWDCNVLRYSLKLTVLNYVRLMFGSGPVDACGRWERLLGP